MSDPKHMRSSVRLDRMSCAPLWLAAASCVLIAAPACAKTKWQTVTPRESPGTVCLRLGTLELAYHRLEAGSPVMLAVSGPRRVKITTRAVLADGTAGPATYTLVAKLDGQEVLRKRVSADPRVGAHVCDAPAAATTSSRTSYLTVPGGAHEITVYAEPIGNETVAARFYRESRRPRREELTFAPEAYAEARRLLFESGVRSTCYSFRDGAPLRFTVKGPTTLRVITRLDFNLTTHGSQPYTLEVSRDGRLPQVFHFEATKHDDVSYAERLDIVPGQPRQMRLTVPRGIHWFTIRCIQPAGACVTAQIRIPKKDLGLP